MRVEVNEANIERFNLVSQTGNSREQMLAMAAQAESNGQVLSVEVPDADALQHNVFDVYESEHIDPRRMDVPESDCSYTQIQDPTDGVFYICDIHSAESLYNVELFPSAPCKVVTKGG